MPDVVVDDNGDRIRRQYYTVDEACGVFDAMLGAWLAGFDWSWLLYED